MTKNLRGNCQHCGGVIEFSAEHAGETAPCPHCQQRTALMLAAPPEEANPLKTRAIIFVSVALLILVGGVVAAQIAIKRAKRMANRDAKPGSPVVAYTNPFAQSGFQASTVTIERATNSTLVYAVGTVTETANRKRFGVQIEIGLFDRNRQPCGTAKDYQASLDAGGQWKFRALVVEKAAVSAKLLSVREGQ